MVRQWSECIGQTLELDLSRLGDYDLTSKIWKPVMSRMTVTTAVRGGGELEMQ